MLSGIVKQQMLLVLAVLASVCLAIAVVRFGAPAAAEAGWEKGVSDDIIVVPIQLGRESSGLVMVDKTRQTLWVYEINTRGPSHSRLALLAARSWRYDRLLDQYNTAEPKPEQVKLLLKQLGQLSLDSQKQQVDSNII